MEALVIHAPGDLRVEPYDTDPLQSGQLRVKVGAGGICGSDLHYYQHGRVGAFVIREPLVPGHEASGVVDAVGSTTLANACSQVKRHGAVAACAC